jgi:hypothetical protein
MAKSKLNVALITAGIAPANFERAAARVAAKSLELYDFREVLVLSQKTLKHFCPVTARRYRDFLKPEVRGYGYWVWKPEFIYRTLAGEFGNFDQVIWIDSGCEINANVISRVIFAGRIEETDNKGVWLHALESSDDSYTKQFVVSQFPEISEIQLRSPQFQANYMHFSSQKALTIAEEWFAKTSENISNVNLDANARESKGFIEHRSDQSILSLVVKKHQIGYDRINLPSGGTNKSAIRAVFEPIWISRNRDGKSTIPKLIQCIP